MDGAGQMQHFVNDDGFNIFRLPVGWQFLTGDMATGTLNQTNLAKYDALVQTCLATGASCIIDVHNYARYGGQVCLMPLVYLFMFRFSRFYSDHRARWTYK